MEKLKNLVTGEKKWKVLSLIFSVAGGAFGLLSGFMDDKVADNNMKNEVSNEVEKQIQNYMKAEMKEVVSNEQI